MLLVCSIRTVCWLQFVLLVCGIMTVCWLQFVTGVWHYDCVLDTVCVAVVVVVVVFSTI